MQVMCRSHCRVNASKPNHTTTTVHWPVSYNSPIQKHMGVYPQNTITANHQSSRIIQHRRDPQAHSALSSSDKMKALNYYRSVEAAIMMKQLSTDC